MRKQKNVFIDLSDLPKYEKGDQKTTEKRRQEYQKKYQTEYQKTAKKIQIRVSETEYEHLSEVAGLNQQTLLSLPILIMIAVILHNGLGLCVGYGLSRLFKFPISATRTLSIETGMQNSGLGVALATAHFSPLAALPGAIFSFWHNFSGIILAKIWSRKSLQLNTFSEDKILEKSLQMEVNLG